MKKNPYYWPALDLQWIVGFILLFLVGTGIAYRQASFLMPDEGAHYLRAYEVSHLHLINYRGAAGVDIPCNDYLVAAQKYNRIPSVQQKAIDGQLDPSCRVKSINPAGAYSFVPYIPAAVALFVTEKLNWQVENRLIAARVANFSVWFCILFYGLLLVNKGRMLMACFVVMPSFFWQLVALSADGATLSSCLLYVFLVLRVAQQEIEITPKLVIAMVLVAALIGASKGVYALVGLLSFALWDRLPGKGNVYKIAVLSAPAIAALLTYSILTAIADPSLVYIGTGASPSLQAALLVKNPLLIIELTFRAIADTDVMLLVAPTFAVPNAGRAFGIMVMALLAMGVLMLSSDFGVNPQFRLTAMLVSLVLFISFCLPLYLTYTPVGNQAIAGLQGRYYLPAIPLVFIATAFDAIKFNRSHFITQLHRNSEWIVATSILSLIVAWFNIK